MGKIVASWDIKLTLHAPEEGAASDSAVTVDDDSIAEATPSNPQIEGILENGLLFELRTMHGIDFTANAVATRTDK